MKLTKVLYCVNQIRVSTFFSVALRPDVCHGLLILEVSRSHTTTHHSRYDSSGRVISSSQRPLPENTQHSQQTNIHGPGGIRTNDLSRRAAVDLGLRPCGHWDRQECLQGKLIRHFNPLNPELNPICCLLALLGAHYFLHVSRIRVESLTLRLLMSYIYIYIWSTHS